MTVWALGVAYNGKHFHGWQRQPNLTTVQGDLEFAVSKIANERVTLSVAGRTDKGVHATGQVAHFKTNADRDVEDWLRGLNGLTPDSIRILWVRAVDDQFHARYGATARTYQYLFLQGDKPDVFLHENAWCVAEINPDKMHMAAQQLVGEHDFTSFRGAGCQSVSPMRRVNRCTVFQRGKFLVMEIDANAFLLHMVRNIAGALQAIGKDEEQRSMAELLALRNREALGVTAPPQGLYLTQVRYPEQDFPPSTPLAWLDSNTAFIANATPLD